MIEQSMRKIDAYEFSKARNRHCNFWATAKLRADGQWNVHIAADYIKSVDFISDNPYPDMLVEFVKWKIEIEKEKSNG